jgi:outer membrane lipoprotein carrier protein
MWHQMRPDRQAGSKIVQHPGSCLGKPWSVPDYSRPQLVVGDGEKVWIYDPELKQITVRKAGQAIGGSPAALLAGSNELEKNFTLAEAGEAEGMNWVEATPKAGDSGFEKVRLGFAGRDLTAMELYDSFGQTTHIRFANVERNPVLPAATFRFTPPAGVDIVGE